MARAVEDHWPDADGAPLEGLVVTRYGHAVACRTIEVVEAAHPVPDQAGLDAARRILRMVQGLGPEDLVLCLLAGGGPAPLSLPAPGLTLAETQAAHNALPPPATGSPPCRHKLRPLGVPPCLPRPSHQQT